MTKGKTATRPYLVSSDNEDHLVEASTPAQAIRHVVGGKYHASVPTTSEALALAAKGIRLERAGEHSDTANV